MICSICSQDKDIDLFPRTPTGTRSYCKLCYRVKRYEARQTPERRAHHNAKGRQWTRENKEKSLLLKKRWRDKNKDYFRNYKEVNAEELRPKRNANTALRRAKLKQAIPPWFDKEEVAYIYRLAKERGLVVDHIVPLNSPHVCGLHVQNNLRCISADLNARKGNRYWPDMWTY